MVKGMLFMLALAHVAGAAHSAESRFGNWEAEDLGTYTAAHTHNESGSAFGLLCGTDCVFFLNINRGCKQGETYPALASGKAGAIPIELKCLELDRDTFLLTFPVQDDGLDLLEGGGTLGFAVPLASGEFGVSRFSLKGGLEASDAAARMADGKAGKDRDGMRDVTI